MLLNLRPASILLCWTEVDMRGGVQVLRVAELHVSARVSVQVLRVAELAAGQHIAMLD